MKILLNIVFCRCSRNSVPLSIGWVGRIKPESSSQKRLEFTMVLFYNMLDCDLRLLTEKYMQLYKTIPSLLPNKKKKLYMF